MSQPRCRAHLNARLSAFYLSRDRVLGLIGVQNLPAQALAALRGKDVTMSSAILSNVVGSYVLDAIAAGGVKTLQKLAFEGTLQAGTQFIYNGHFYGSGFGDRNKTPAEPHSKSALTKHLRPIRRKCALD